MYKPYAKSSEVASKSYVFAAVMFDNWAFRPVCLSPAWVSAESLSIKELPEVVEAQRFATYS